MKLKLYEILNAVEVLKKVFNSSVNLKLAYRLSKMSKKCQEELTLVQETQKKLFDKYGEENEKKEQVIPKDNVDAYQTELAEFLNTEVDMKFDPVVIDENEKIELSANELLAVEKILTITETK